MTDDDSADLFAGVPAFDSDSAGADDDSTPQEFYTPEQLGEMPHVVLVEHILCLQRGYCRLDDDVKFLNWEFRDYQNNLTYFSRAAKLAHKLNAASLDDIASIAVQEIPHYFHCDFSAMFLYDDDADRFSVFHTSNPELTESMNTDEARNAAVLFERHHYPYLIECTDEGALVETDSGEVLVPQVSNSAFWDIMSNGALVFPLWVKNRDYPEPDMLGGLVLSAARQRLEVSDAEVSILFCDLLSSSLYNARLLQKLNELTIIDPLTQIFNRRHLINQLDAAMIQAWRQGHSLSLVITDIDFFKRFNDDYGHICGDNVLRAVGAVLRGGIRTGVDLAARYGGEEFVLMLPFTNLKAAMDVAERIRSQVKNASVQFGGKALRVSCSFGVAEYVPGETLERFIDRADAALYRAKGGGRDRVEAAPEPVETADAIEAAGE